MIVPKNIPVRIGQLTEEDFDQEFSPRRPIDGKYSSKALHAFELLSERVKRQVREDQK